MGWLGSKLASLVTKIAGAPPVDLIFVPSIAVPGIPGIGEAIEPDECYLELYLESMRLERARSFTTKFNAVVYSFVSLSREGDSRATLAAVSKPEKLSDLDNKSLDKVITISKQMMAATAYRGGPVSIELGLFSVKSENVLSTLLGYVTKVSDLAGISFVGTVKPFLPLITEGMDIIAGQTQDSVLEVGVDADLSLKQGAFAAIISQSKGKIDVTKLTVDPTDHKLMLDGKPLECGYTTFSVRPVAQKDDYGEIPELKDKYAAFITALKSGKQADAQENLTAFRLAAWGSPDLIPKDAEALVKKAQAKLDGAFGTGARLTGATAKARPALAAAPKSHKSETLADIGLYN